MRSFFTKSPGPAAVVVGGVWAVLCFVLLYFLNVTDIDDWCYLASGVAARWPFGLKAPGLGTFLGADHRWGLHWPGAPLIYSLSLPLLPWSPAVWVILFIGMAAALVWLTYRLLGRYLGDPWLAAAGALILIADRGIFAIMLLSRPEMLSLLVLVVLASLLRRWNLPSARWRSAATGACFFLLPLMHPMFIPIGGALCLYVGARAWRRGEWAHWVVYAACYASGFLMLIGWFYFQPDAWLQFQIDAKGNYQPFSWGMSFVRFQLSGAPLYTNVPLYALAFGDCVALWPGWRREFRSMRPDRAGIGERTRLAPENDWGLPACLFLSGMAAAQCFPNTLYHNIVLPFTILLAVAALRLLVRRWPRPVAAWALPAIMFAFVLVHGAFWFSRTARYVLAGRPRLRAEIRTIYDSLPTNHRIVAPTIMWQEGLTDPDRFLLNTLPFPSTPQVRQAYEDYVFEQMKPGDLLIVSPIQKPGMQSALPPAEWEFVRRYEHHLPGKNYWGYDLNMYRKR